MFARATLAGLMVLLMAGWAAASLIDADGGDTEFAPIDLGDIYVDYDNTNIYVRYEHDHDGWGGVQIGMAFVTDHSGGSIDPWGRQIAFGGMCLPHYVAYINLDSGWNEWCSWNDGGWWDRIPNGLGWTYAGPVDELVIPYAMLGIDCRVFSNMGFEMWVTQDSPTKGPLDLSMNDNLQLSTPGGTTWDISTPVLIACYHCIILNAPSATEATTWGNIKALYR